MNVRIMFAKFDEDAHNDLKFKLYLVHMVSALRMDKRTDWWTDGTTAALRF